jgi:hypothetical protein
MLTAEISVIVLSAPLVMAAQVGRHKRLSDQTAFLGQPSGAFMAFPNLALLTRGLALTCPLAAGAGL